jgi:hypothetical protein
MYAPNVKRRARDITEKPRGAADSRLPLNLCERREPMTQEDFEKIVHTFIGVTIQEPVTKHAPNVYAMEWGDYLFIGTPLQTKVHVSFCGDEFLIPR